MGQILHEFLNAVLATCVCVVAKSLDCSHEECVVCGYFLLMLMLLALTSQLSVIGFIFSDLKW